MTVDGGPALALYRSLIAQRLRGEVRAGRAAPGDVDSAAEVVARMAMSLLLTPEGVINLDDQESVRSSCASRCCRCCDRSMSGPRKR